MRSSTQTGYLNENVVTQGNEFFPDEFGVGRRQLVILAKSTVNKILFKHHKGAHVAIGVEFVEMGKHKLLLQEKELSFQQVTSPPSFLNVWN